MDAVDRSPTPPLWQSGLQWAGLFAGLGVVMTLSLGLISFTGRGLTPSSARGLVFATAIFGAVSVVLLAVLAWWYVLYRRVLEARADALAGHDPRVEVLPLTAQMTAFLQEEATTGRSWRKLVTLVMGAAIVIPAVPTVVYLAEGWAMAVIPAVWLMTLAIGGILSFALLHHIGQERRDLDRGVYLRESGRFDTRFRSTKAGTCVIVSIGGWSYNPVWGPMIQNVGPGRGSVSYLPISQDVLEIRDESGRLLWSLFAPDEARAAAQAPG